MESEVQKFYSGSSILLTGATGFLGKILLEKLLRSCPDIETIYVVIRAKNGKNPRIRLAETLDSPVFGPLKSKQPDFHKKIILVQGDAELSDYGFVQGIKETIINNVDVIINNASCVKYDEKIKVAIKVNVQGLQTLIQLAKLMKKLKSFIHISTVFSNFPRPEIEEIIYDAPMDGEKLLSMVNTMPDDILNNMKDTILGDWPNPIVFTKAVAESLVQSQAKNLPICIARPSIVMSTYKEPIPGWNEIIAGPSKLTLAYLTGVFHVPFVKKTAAADLMPADYVANAIIAAGLANANKDRFMKETIENYQSTIDESIFEETRKESDVPVFNIISSTLNVITWGEFWKNLRIFSEAIPVEKHVWFQYLHLTQCKFVYFFYMYLFHYFPAYIMDFALKCIGREGQYVKLVTEMDQMSRLMKPFVTKEFTIINNNTLNLWSNLNERDKTLFTFDVIRLNWFDFLRTHVMGCRQYLVKEDLSNIEEAIAKNRTLRMINIIAAAIVVYLFAKSFLCIYNYVL